MIIYTNIEPCDVNIKSEHYETFKEIDIDKSKIIKLYICLRQLDENLNDIFEHTNLIRLTLNYCGNYNNISSNYYDILLPFITKLSSLPNLKSLTFAGIIIKTLTNLPLGIEHLYFEDHLMMHNVKINFPPTLKKIEVALNRISIIEYEKNTNGLRNLLKTKIEKCKIPHDCELILLPCFYFSNNFVKRDVWDEIIIKKLFKN